MREGRAGGLFSGFRPPLVWGFCTPPPTPVPLLPGPGLAVLGLPALALPLLPLSPQPGISVKMEVSTVQPDPAQLLSVTSPWSQQKTSAEAQHGRQSLAPAASPMPLTPCASAVVSFSQAFTWVRLPHPRAFARAFPSSSPG